MFLCSGVSERFYGRRCWYTIRQMCSQFDNLKSTDEHPQVVQDYIVKELQAGRIEGRFLQPPFSKYQMSPFGRERQGKFGLFTI